MKGYRNCVLWVNLSTGTIIKKSLNRSYIEKFIGGEGYGSALLWYEVPYTTHAFSPRNILSFNTGPLTGVLANSSSTSVVFLSPLSNWTGASDIDGQLGTSLKHAGYDSLVIEGASETPTYLYIDNDIVELRDASRIWGKNTIETMDTIKSETGDDFKIACIGQAGERLSRLACILTDEGSFARAGSGSVMGCKKLKAIALKGYKGKTSGPKISFKNDFVPFDIKHGVISALKNKYDIDLSKDISIAAHYTEIYGIDPILTFATISEAVKWYNKGIISTKDTGGIEFRYENADAMLDIIKKIGLREGSGETFADGLYYAALKLGLDCNFGQIGNNILDMVLDTPEGGNYHIGSNAISSEIFNCLTSEFGPETSENRTGKLLKAMREYHMLLNMLGISSASMIKNNVTPDDITELYSSGTGINIDKSELFEKPERVLSLQRALNYKKGFNRKNDYIPCTFLKTLSYFRPEYKTSLCTDRALTSFYEACCYDENKAIPKPSKFLELGMDDMLDEL